MLRLPHRLKQYHVPDDIREVIECQEDISFMCPCLNEPLSWESYQEYFTVLVHSEEVQVELNMREFDMKMVCRHLHCIILQCLCHYTLMYSKCTIVHVLIPFVKCKQYTS